MSVKLYMDEHVPGPITRALRVHGVNVITAQEDQHDGSPDSALLDRAGALGRVMFTRDDDFLREATRRLRVRESFLGVIYTHQIGLSIGECIQELELIAFATETEEYRNRVEYLPL